MASVPNTVQRPLRIFIADDSAVVRHSLTLLFQSLATSASPTDPPVQLCGTAADGVACVESIRTLRPDLLLLDLEMPRMDGMAVLEIVRRDWPSMPVIMCSAHTERGATATLEALARGAIDYVTKPAGFTDTAAATASLSAQLVPRLHALAEKMCRPGPTPALPPWRQVSRAHVPARIVAIGVSTGGPAALERILPQLPQDLDAPVLVVQHMPRLFTGALARRLDSLCVLPVREATHGARLHPGHIWIAPGDRHMEVVHSSSGAHILVHDQPPLNHCRPAVDILFPSVAKVFRAQALGVVLTGMGSDGLAGARALAAAGAAVIAQDRATSAVWGMPGRVASAGLAAEVLPLDAIAGCIAARVAATSRTERSFAAHAMQ